MGDATALVLRCGSRSAQKLSATIIGNQDDFTIQTEDFTIHMEIRETTCVIRFDSRGFKGVWKFKANVLCVELAVSILSWLNLLITVNKQLMILV